MIKIFHFKYILLINILLLFLCCSPTVETYPKAVIEAGLQIEYDKAKWEIYSLMKGCNGSNNAIKPRVQNLLAGDLELRKLHEENQELIFYFEFIDSKTKLGLQPVDCTFYHAMALNKKTKLFTKIFGENIEFDVAKNDNINNDTFLLGDDFVEFLKENQYYNNSWLKRIVQQYEK